jgi:hypothetical protein
MVHHYKVSVNGNSQLYIHVLPESVIVGTWNSPLGEFIQGRKSRWQAAKMVSNLRKKEDCKIERLSDY